MAVMTLEASDSLSEIRHPLAFAKSKPSRIASPSPTKQKYINVEIIALSMSLIMLLGQVIQKLKYSFPQTTIHVTRLQK